MKTGDNKKLFRFAEVKNCRSVKQNLRELVYGVTSLFAVGCLISICTAASSCYLLYKARKKRSVRFHSLYFLRCTSYRYTQHPVVLVNVTIQEKKFVEK